MKIKVEEYIRPDGRSPYAEWFDDLDVQAAAKVSVAKLRMEMGNTSSVKWFEGIGEYRIDWGSGLPHLPRPRWRNAHRAVWRWDQANADQGHRYSEDAACGVQGPETGSGKA